MNRICEKAASVLRFLKSRTFMVCVMAVVMSLTVYAVSATTNTVYIKDQDSTTIAYTSKEDPDEILKAEGIEVGEDDAVAFSGFEGGAGEIVIDRAYPVTIEADGVTRTVMMTDGTVADALRKASVSLGSEDLISISPYEFTEAGDHVVINRVEYVTTTYEETIPFETEYKETPLLYNGSTRCLQRGEDGIRVLTYVETTIDGVVHEAELIGENVVKKPVTEQYLLGADVPVSDLDFGYQIVDNAPVSYRYVISNAVSTGYSARPGAWGASGNTLSAGHVAVDPSEIPYNSRLYITSADGSFVYGYAIASDTGTGLLNDVIDVDLFYDTYLESALNGRKSLNIYVLG
jgi:3D (Asp-Asp-Asp) domain-containing protein